MNIDELLRQTRRIIPAFLAGQPDIFDRPLYRLGALLFIERVLLELQDADDGLLESILVEQIAAELLRAEDAVLAQATRREVFAEGSTDE